MMRKVSIRQQFISGNKSSLFLDYYPAIDHPLTGKPTRREFLNLAIHNDFVIEEIKYVDKNGIDRRKFEPVYIEKRDRQNRVNTIPKPRKLSSQEKEYNKAVLILAEQIRQKRENEINKPEVYTDFEREQIRNKEMGNKSFISYFEKLADKRTGKNWLIWTSSLKYLKNFKEGDIRFKDLTEEFCNNFREHLLTSKSRKSKKKTLAINSALSYHNKFKAVLKQAHKDGYIKDDLNARIENIKPEEVERDRLTEEELNSLVKAECFNPLAKRAALFSALTGLRFSDIQKLTWDEVEFIKDQGYYINFRQQKTKGIEVLPISDQAFSLMGERKEPGTRVFEGLIYSASENKLLSEWGQNAGIRKKIRWHILRHSFATIQLTKGSSMEVVQKALGHKDLKTTQIYGKIVNKLLREAMDRIKLDM